MIFLRAGVLGCIVAAVLVGCGLWAEHKGSGMPAQQSSGDLTAQERAIWPNLPPNQDPAAVARGKILFESNCSFCHGADATGGNGGPDLIRSVLVNHDDHGNLIGPTVHNGRPGRGMPAFRNLTDAQISDLVAYLHQQNRDDRIRITYKVGQDITGDVSGGKTYFTEHCAQCHSTTGDLAGIGSRYEPGVLQQLWLRGGGSESRSDPRLRKTVRVSLASGQRFEGTLQHLDEFNVAFYDADGYHSFERGPGVTVTVHDPVAAHQELLGHLTDSDMHNVTVYLETLK